MLSNLFWTKRISLEQRHKALYTLKELPIIVDTLTSDHAWLETMELAERYGLTLYDASYLELSLRRSLPLITFDKSLKKAAEMASSTHSTLPSDDEDKTSYLHES
ncbi:MAG: type II toxin-antitoxin system VapC family toxin [Proteobacteria bacterium]|nr:type II toxin-antitoxin system VapC family toxin [Pseudomonadota bacterium]